MTSASELERRDAALDYTPGRGRFIYAITFVQTGKRYIGQTINPRLRWYTHKSKLRMNKHWCVELQNDWNANGKTAFTFTIIQDGLKNSQKANDAERHHIMLSDCYNYLVVTDPSTGKLTAIDLLRQRHSENLKRAWNDPNSDLRTPYRTRWSDPKERKRQSIAMKKRYSDPEERKRHSAATKAGQTEEVRKRKSDSAKASWANPNSKQRLIIRKTSKKGLRSKKEKMRIWWASEEGNALRERKRLKRNY